MPSKRRHLSEARSAEIARRMREARATTPQHRVAARAGISPSWHGLLEKEPAFLTRRTARRIAAALGLDLQELQP